MPDDSVNKLLDLMEEDAKRTAARKKEIKQREKLICYQNGFIFSIIFLIFLIGVAIFCLIYWPIKVHPHGLIVHEEKDKAYHLALVDEINRKQNKWKAKYNPNAAREKDYSLDDSMINMEAFTTERYLQDTKEHLIHLISLTDPLPANFDARHRWPHCYSISQISDQAGCGACWAVAAASTMSDRVCIASNGNRQDQISHEDLLSCCETCGGCVGGFYSIEPFAYWKDHGIVTGGEFNSTRGCRPYSKEPNCGSPCSPITYRNYLTPKCVRECRPGYRKSYEEDLIKGRKVYWIWAEPLYDSAQSSLYSLQESLGLAGTHHGIELIKRELYHFGPIKACMLVHVEFQHYHYGIYELTTDSEVLYGHCMRLIGWGTDGQNHWWLYANSWGKNWGENGYVRIDMHQMPTDTASGIL